MVSSSVAFCVMAALVRYASQIDAAMGQLLMTEGFKYVSVFAGSLLDMLFPVLSLLVGVILFHEHLSSIELIGAVVVVTACTIVIFSNRRAAPRAIAL